MQAGSNYAMRPLLLIGEEQNGPAHAQNGVNDPKPTFVAISRHI
jgi:hypothetical protein